jgi:hypothetical protein
MVADCRRTPFVAALLAALTAAGGCVSSESAPSGSAATEDVENRDTMECMSIAREVRAGPQGPRTTIDPDRYQQCMRERGHASGPAR